MTIKKSSIPVHQEFLQSLKKIISQIILAIIGVSLFVYFNDYQYLNNYIFPFFKNLVVNLGWFYTICNICNYGSSNAVNLTDGLDGLATVACNIGCSMFFLYKLRHWKYVFSNYLQIPYIRGQVKYQFFVGQL